MNERPGSFFTPHSFKLYSEAILKKVLPGFIIGRHNFNNIRYEEGSIDSRDRKETTITPIRSYRSKEPKPY